MTVHDEILGQIEQQVSADGACLEAVDERIAAELGVSVECYVGYLVVWSALERYRERVGENAAASGDNCRDAHLHHAHELVDFIGMTASTVYQDTAGAGHTDVNNAAARVLVAAMQLRHCLASLPAHVLTGAGAVPHLGSPRNPLDHFPAPILRPSL